MNIWGPFKNFTAFPLPLTAHFHKRLSGRALHEILTRDHSRDRLGLRGADGRGRRGARPRVLTRVHGPAGGWRPRSSAQPRSLLPASSCASGALGHEHKSPGQLLPSGNFTGASSSDAISSEASRSMVNLRCDKTEASRPQVGEARVRPGRRSERGSCTVTRATAAARTAAHVRLKDTTAL